MHIPDLLHAQVCIAKQNGSGEALRVIKPWPVISAERLADYRVFSVRRVVRRSPRTGGEHDFFVLDAPDWVNVIAITTDGQMVMVEQFRHGTESVDLEIPGGVMDPQDASPIEAGVRELREETGYAGENARLIGSVRPNPAILSNTCHTVLVENCRRCCNIELDHAEDVATRLVPARQAAALVADGTIRHSLVVAAIYDYELSLRGCR